MPTYLHTYKLHAFIPTCLQTACTHACHRQIHILQFITVEGGALAAPKTGEAWPGILELGDIKSGIWNLKIQEHNWTIYIYINTTWAKQWGFRPGFHVIRPDEETRWCTFCQGLPAGAVVELWLEHGLMACRHGRLHHICMRGPPSQKTRSTS